MKKNTHRITCKCLRSHKAGKLQWNCRRHGRMSWDACKLLLRIEAEHQQEAKNGHTISQMIKLWKENPKRKIIYDLNSRVISLE